MISHSILPLRREPKEPVSRAFSFCLFTLLGGPFCRCAVSAITRKARAKNGLRRASTTLSILSAMQGRGRFSHFPTGHARDGLIRDLGRRDDAAVVGPRGWLEAVPKGDSLGFVVFQRVRSAANFAQPEMLHGMSIGWTAFIDRALRKTKQLAVPMMECG